MRQHNFTKYNVEPQKSTIEKVNKTLFLYLLKGALEVY
jgi:hypothetical protein